MKKYITISVFSFITCFTFCATAQDSTSNLFAKNLRLGWGVNTGFLKILNSHVGEGGNLSNLNYIPLGAEGFATYKSLNVFRYQYLFNLPININEAGYDHTASPNKVFENSNNLKSTALNFVTGLIYGLFKDRNNGWHTATKYLLSNINYSKFNYSTNIGVDNSKNTNKQYLLFSKNDSITIEAGDILSTGVNTKYKSFDIVISISGLKKAFKYYDPFFENDNNEYKYNFGFVIGMYNFSSLAVSDNNKFSSKTVIGANSYDNLYKNTYFSKGYIVGYNHEFRNKGADNFNFYLRNTLALLLPTHSEIINPNGIPLNTNNLKITGFTYSFEVGGQEALTFGFRHDVFLKSDFHGDIGRLNWYLKIRSSYPLKKNKQ